MDEVDRVASRVSLSALIGLVGGAAVATYRGAHVPKASLSTAGSCALLGTVCFGIERLSNVTIKSLSSKDDDNHTNHTTTRRLYASHALGGLTGGGIAGGIFQRQPLSGMALLTPIMCIVAFSESKLEEKRREKLLQAMQIDETGESNEAKLSET